MCHYCYRQMPDPFFYQTLKAGQAVFFGCDVGQFSEGSSGIMDTELFEYEVSPYFIGCRSGRKSINRFQECFRHLAFSFKGRPFAHQ
jgi:hypothetical protein